MIVVVIMHSEITILDEIRSAYLAIRVQSRFAHSSNLQSNRVPKGKEKKKKDVEIFRDKSFFQIYTKYAV